MELIQELKEIALELAAETGLSYSEALQIAVQIQRNRILEDSFLAGRSENISFFDPNKLSEETPIKRVWKTMEQIEKENKLSEEAQRKRILKRLKD